MVREYVVSTEEFERWAFVPSEALQQAYAVVRDGFHDARDVQRDVRERLGKALQEGSDAREQMRELLHAQTVRVLWSRLEGVFQLAFEEGATEEQVWRALRGKMRAQERAGWARRRRELP